MRAPEGMALEVHCFCHVVSLARRLMRERSVLVSVAEVGGLFVAVLRCRIGSMASHAWALFLGVVLMASGAMGAAPRRPVAVPFGRNYVPTWAFDHIKYYNGGSEIQLYLDKYTGEFIWTQGVECGSEVGKKIPP